MRCCLNMRSHASNRIALSNLKHKLLKIEKRIIHRDDIPTNELSLIKADNESKNGPVDMIIKNASLINHPSEERFCVAISENLISFIGDFEKIHDNITSVTTIIDAKGKTILPGFCDSHVHLMVASERYQGVSVEDARTPNEFVEKVTEFIARNPGLPAYHVYGLHYFDPPIIPAPTTRQFLDEIHSDRPLFVYAHDLHTGWANSKAIELADIDKTMPPFPRLVEELGLQNNIELDSKGVPTGEFREPDAYFLVEGPIRQTYPLTVEQKLDNLRQALQTLASLGLTSVHNMGLALPEEDIELMLLLLELEQKDELPVRVHFYYSIIPDEHMLSDIHYASKIRDQLHKAREGKISSVEFHQFLTDTLQEVANLRHEHCLNLENHHPQLKGHRHIPFVHSESMRLHSHFHEIHVNSHLNRLAKRLDLLKDHKLDPNGKFDIGGVKAFMDGVIEKDTAFRLDKKPIPGIPAFSQEHLEQVVSESDRAGLQVTAHCIGDGSVKAVLDAVAVARKRNDSIDASRGHRIRHRIEHIELCPPDALDTFVELDVTPSMQPLHERPPTTMWHQKVPREMWQRAFPWKDFLNMGLKLVFGSDWPIVSCNCFDGMKRAVNRTPWAPDLPNQCLTEEEVIKAFSSHPAYLEYRERIKGELSTGMFADLIILSDNIHHIAKEHIDHAQVQQTISGGKTTYMRK